MTTNEVPNCTICGVALKLSTPRRSAARWIHTVTPPAPHVAETDAAIPAPVSFETILDLEHEVRITKVSAVFAPSSFRLDQKTDRYSNAASAQARLFAALDALTPAEQVAFGKYRSSSKG